ARGGVARWPPEQPRSVKPISSDRMTTTFGGAAATGADGPRRAPSAARRPTGRGVRVTTGPRGGVRTADDAVLARGGRSGKPAAGISAGDAHGRGLSCGHMKTKADIVRDWLPRYTGRP